jgi:type II secretory pathway pseudopilin PulG
VRLCLNQPFGVPPLGGDAGVCEGRQPDRLKVELRTSDRLTAGIQAKPAAAPWSGNGVSRRRSFTLLELLVAVSLMTLIVIALFSIFNQTQRALRGNIAQVDVNEAGRAAMDLMVGDLQECMPSGLEGGTNLWGYLAGPNPPLVQPLMGGGARTNVLQSLFFLTRSNAVWTADGYFVASPSGPTVPLDASGVGTLYRFSAQNLPPTNRLDTNLVADLVLQFMWSQPGRQAKPLFAQLHSLPVADGVVHLRFQPFDFLGLPVSVTNSFWYPTVRFFEYHPSFNLKAPPNVLLTPDYVPPETRYVFLSNALPRCVEVDLGILEPQTYDQWKGIPNATMAAEFLTNHVGQVHLFRQRVPILTGTPQ